MTLAETEAKIAQDFGQALAVARAEEDARLDLERRTEAAHKLFDAEYVQPQWGALITAITEPIGKLIRNQGATDELQAQFRAAYTAAKAAVAPVEKFFHKEVCDEWVAWLREADRICGRCAAARTPSDRESFSSDFGGLQSRAGVFHKMTTKPNEKTPRGERLNDAIALAQTLNREDLAKYMS